MKISTSRSAVSAPQRVGLVRAVTIGLRKGKIRAAKASASEIRRAIGVTPADERVAAKALMVAAARPKAKSGVARTAKKTRPKIRTKAVPKKR